MKITHRTQGDRQHLICDADGPADPPLESVRRRAERLPDVSGAQRTSEGVELRLVSTAVRGTARAVAAYLHALYNGLDPLT